MKKIVVLLVLAVLSGLLVSCASSQGIERPLSEVPHAEIIGEISVNFIGHKDNASDLAYSSLMAAAGKEYSGQIDVRNITWFYRSGAGSYSSFTAKGTVVRATLMSNIEGALERAVEDVSENFTARSLIAIVYITAQDRSTTEFITGELEHILQKRGFVIIDRSELDRIRREQNFQLGGEVDDETAISIGRFTGANVIVTGRVDGEGNLRRLRLRALNTQTAQVVGTASERL